MAGLNGKIEVVWKTRACSVDGVFGCFQMWVPTDPPRAVVEFSDGVRQVEAEKIQFTDWDHQFLEACEKHRMEGFEL